MTPCKVDGCSESVYVKKHQLCVTHYHRWHRHGDPTAFKRKQGRAVCSVGDCADLVVGDGLCDKHYRRMRRYGTTEQPERPTVCIEDGCDLPVQALARCDRHYRRVRSGTAGSRQCTYCGGEIDPSRNTNARYCSKTCLEREHFVRRQEEHRANWLRQYGLTVEQYDELLSGQGGGCAICGTQTPPARGGCFAVDHDHETGAVRGLLCIECNSGLGMFKDEVDLLQSAIVYLATAQATETPIAVVPSRRRTRAPRRRFPVRNPQAIAPMPYAPTAIDGEREPKGNQPVHVRLAWATRYLTEHGIEVRPPTKAIPGVHVPHPGPPPAPVTA